MTRETDAPPVTIIVPVYGDWPSLKDCIESLKQHVDTEKHRIMLVNDCGPEADAMEHDIIRTIDGQSEFSYYRNPGNLGFVGTCNRAVLELDDSGNDVLLLNSDTVATEGFLEEIRHVLYSESHIAAVSPRSNSASIATLPREAAPRGGIGARKSYKMYQTIKPYMPQYTLSLVVHGFCMLIRREVIDAHKLFDPEFGQGYGEEVDFCLRMHEHGWIGALSNWAYVFHREARSFSLVTKRHLLEEHDKIIRQRYPDFSKRMEVYTNKLLETEASAMAKADISVAETEPRPLRRLLKRNKHIYRLSRKVYRVLKR